MAASRHLPGGFSVILSRGREHLLAASKWRRGGWSIYKSRMIDKEAHDR